MNEQLLDTNIRWMIRRDMSEVLEIENECFEFAWTEADFIECLQKRNCIGMVAEQNEKVLGYMIYELHKNHLEILNFAVASEHRLSGVGRKMIDKLIKKLSFQRRTMIKLAVRETNLSAQLFFKKLNFKAVSIIHDYYEDTNEDAYIMHYNYNEPDAALAALLKRGVNILQNEST